MKDSSHTPAHKGKTSSPRTPAKQRGALEAFADPKLMLEREIRSLMSRYDALDVRKIVLKLTKQKTGRKAINDFARLKDNVMRDAVEWMDGQKPLENRSNYSIAKRYAERFPGHSAPATMRRVQRKLSRAREWWMLTYAMFESERERPYAIYLAACDAISRLDHEFAHHGQTFGDTARGAIERYRSLLGDPEPDLTMEDIRNEADEATRRKMNQSSPVNGLLSGFIGARGNHSDHRLDQPYKTDDKTD